MISNTTMYGEVAYFKTKQQIGKMFKHKKHTYSITRDVTHEKYVSRPYMYAYTVTKR